MARIKDKSLILKSLRLISHGIDPQETLDRLQWGTKFNIFSSATGDNTYFNTIAQFSPATDPRIKRAMVSEEGGMGHMYKTMYDDNVSTVTLVAGVPEFAGLIDFVSNMIDGEAAVAANKGRAPGIAFYLAQGAASVAFWPFQLVSISATFLQFLFDTPNSSFYNLKRATGHHMMIAQGVLNDIMVKLGYIIPVLPIREDSSYNLLHGMRPGNKEKLSNELSRLGTFFPGCINQDGTIDLLKLSMKGARKYAYMLDQVSQLDDNASITTVAEKDAAIQQIVETLEMTVPEISGQHAHELAEMEINAVSGIRGSTEQEAKNTEKMSAYYRAKANQQVIDDSKAANKKIPDEEFKDAYLKDEGGWYNDVKTMLTASFHGGLNGVTFRLDNDKGSVSDSFSNSATSSPLEDKFNGLTQTVNQIKFATGGMNTGFDPIDTIKNMGVDAINGALSGSVIGNIPLALANNSYIRLPKHWESFSTNLHRETFTIESHCTYAHPYEQIVKIWALFAMILPLVAGASTGASSHSAPLMVSAFSKGKTFIRTGMVESANFTFGEGDAGWTLDRKPLNLKIDLNVVDLDPLVNVPIMRGGGLFDLSNPAHYVKRMLNDTHGYNNYLSRLTAVDYLDTVLKYRILNQRLTSAKLNITQTFSAQNIAAKVSDSVVSDVFRIFHKQMAR